MSCLYLAFYEHGHVHEHVVQLFDGRFQLDDVGVAGLDVRQSLLRLSRVHHDALREDRSVALKEEKNCWVIVVNHDLLY